MIRESHHRITVQRVQRMRNTRDGNPRYRLLMDDRELVTARDSHAALSVDDTWEDVELDVTLRNGEVVELSRVPEQGD